MKKIKKDSPYETILKAVSLEITKCKATALAKSIGATGKWNINGVIGGTLDQLTYDDGTVITFNEDGSIREVINKDFSKQILNNDSEGFFKHQKDYIISKYGEEEYDFFRRYSERINGVNGDVLNEMLNGKKLEDIREDYDMGIGFPSEEEMNEIMEGLPRYTKILEGNNLSTYGDFFTWNRVSELDSTTDIDKSIVKDKGMTRASVGTTNELFYSPFTSMGEERTTYDYDDNDWTIITIHEHNNDSYGAYIGEMTPFGEMSKEVKSAPSQKNKRDIIDVKNHLIIQRPYHTPTT